MRKRKTQSSHGFYSGKSTYAPSANLTSRVTPNTFLIIDFLCVKFFFLSFHDIKMIRSIIVIVGEILQANKPPSTLYRNVKKKTTSICTYNNLNSTTSRKTPFEGCPRGVMVKVVDCGTVVREFELPSCYFVHFRANTLRKGLNLFILPVMG